jgi:hypothetical protein
LSFNQYQWKDGAFAALNGPDAEVLRSACRLGLRLGALEASRVAKSRVDNLGNAHGLQPWTSGYKAGLGIVELMEKTHGTLKPMDILNAYANAGGTPTGPKVAVLDALWDSFKDETADVMVLGARYLANLWDSAWKTGAGQTPAVIKALDPNNLKDKYLKVSFVSSLTIDQIHTVLSAVPRGTTAASASGTPSRGSKGQSRTRARTATRAGRHERNRSSKATARVRANKKRPRP